MKYILTLALLAAPFVTAQHASTLDGKAKAKGKYFGTATDAGLLSSSSNSNIIKTEFGQVSPENSMKWDATEPSQNSFSFGNADTLVSFAQTNGKTVRGHTLVWHSQLPSWVSAITSATTLTSVMQNHIATLAGRFKGKIYAWDVVNEVFEENGTFRNSVFYKLLGEQFIDIAFKAAAAADPSAKLCINDYNLDGPGSKIDALIALVGRLQSRGVPIHCIGSQSHLILGQVGGVKAQLQRLADTGLDVMITELDIRIPLSVTTAKLAQQQTDFQTVVSACTSITKCLGVTVWGVSDKDSWVDSTFPTYDSPLLWDDNFAKKPAYTGALAGI
ncbi:glycosyl hydrolase family 10 protein [Tricharina praecox]|uniref:glycosyl hydrolase family 10 protein n=1 Tax=Tricharina praecox TaxID=43433 RepID=UPI0022206A66|nr:glycosyl hydrolase family 10 protein [Tricharina praecox]KAI5853784.1 glycosyl hydrolase family 10 protein [Tricharina praecox]